MIERRTLVSSGVVAGLAAVASAAAAADTATEQGSSADIAMREVAKAIDRLRQSLEAAQNSCELGECREVMQIREVQRTFLRANRKYPDFIDVGIGIWDRIYDWHVKNRQTLNVVRMQDGNYGMGFMFTTLVLRPEQTPGYVSFGYDSRG